ncbi:4-hydroxybutyrate CoA-transferase, partial [Mycolicibacterium diernhoferi]
MPVELTAEQAAARLRSVDTLGIPLGPGQPPAFLRALGERDDWTDLRVYGALLAVLTELFNHKGVHYLSGFYGPLDRALRDSGADVEFLPADFRRFGPLLRRQAPRVVATVATPPDADGWCSLSLHAGGTIDELHRAGADPDRLLIVEASDAFPRTYGLGEDNRHALHVDEIDILVHSSEAPPALPGGDAPPSEIDRAIAQNAVGYMPSGVTL